jgi:hypothetical protein
MFFAIVYTLVAATAAEMFLSKPLHLSLPYHIGSSWFGGFL